jgi:hypothetical protein
VSANPENPAISTSPATIGKKYGGGGGGNTGNSVDG